MRPFALHSIRGSSVDRQGSPSKIVSIVHQSNEHIDNRVWDHTIAHILYRFSILTDGRACSAGEWQRKGEVITHGPTI